LNFLAGIVEEIGYELDSTPFPCLNFVGRASSLESDGKDFELFISPYSLDCDITTEILSVSTPELMATVTHTLQDTPDLIKPAKLVEVARALECFVSNASYS
jgi:hypothetical protein